jgi:hypothetical protein
MYIHNAGSMCLLPIITFASPQLVIMRFLKCLSIRCRFVLLIDRNCAVLPKTSNIHSRRMMLLHEGGVDDNSKRQERASDDGAA